jgi:antitoxin HicB
MSTGTVEEYLKLDYPVEIRAIPAELGGGYSACIPHLGRWAFFADGDTPQEAMEHLDEVKAALFEDMLEHGKKIPLPPPLPEEQAEEEYSGRILLRISRDLHREVAQRAEANGCSINHYIATALAKHVGGDQQASEIAAKLHEAFEHLLTSAMASWRLTPAGIEFLPPEASGEVVISGYGLPLQGTVESQQLQRMVA